jgi:hypothetical protein
MTFLGPGNERFEIGIIDDPALIDHVASALCGGRWECASPPIKQIARHQAQLAVAAFLHFLLLQGVCDE